MCSLLDTYNFSKINIMDISNNRQLNHYSSTLTFLQQLLFPQQFLKMELELATMASDGEGDGGIEEVRADGSGGP